VTRYLTLNQALTIAELATGGEVAVRDIGLLDSALHRPQASMFGQQAYPDLFTKAAALLQSLAMNHPLIDGNKRLAWAACTVFCRKNDVVLNATQDEVYDFVIAVASGKLDAVDDIAGVLRGFAERD
jgi:death-on-curing protein